MFGNPKFNISKFQQFGNKCTNCNLYFSIVTLYQMLGVKLYQISINSSFFFIARLFAKYLCQTLIVNIVYEHPMNKVKFDESKEEEGHGHVLTCDVWFLV